MNKTRLPLATSLLAIALAVTACSQSQSPTDTSGTTPAVNAAVAAGSTNALQAGIKPYPLTTCAVCGMKLGEMGTTPVSFTYKDMEIKTCDMSEEKEFLATPDKYLKPILEAEAKTNN